MILTEYITTVMSNNSEPLIEVVSRGQPLPVVVGKNLGVHTYWSCGIYVIVATKEFN